ncbi:MetQ/NlpA family ABC transporter substrate-binding protein [Sporomusa aerivorans]|uniref:MetQ/NlpA family ABC transporter substrate-binding protein n=1 Tax=Sporomusa aerivorans TaxID=204936 RepID=UPI00352AF6C6
MKKAMALLLICLLGLSVVGCGNSKSADTAASSQEKKSITVGTSPIFKDIVAAAKEDFDKDGYVLNIKVFDDLVTPNIALQEGSIDANVYQHGPYLEQFNQNKGTTLAPYNGGLVKYFMGVFSKKIKNINDLQAGATVSIPNDPSNRSRALKMLQANGLIKLKDGAAMPTKLDIVENKKNLNIVEMDVMKLVSSLDDVDCSTINSVIAVQGNVDPKSAIALEDKAESDKYSIVIAVQKDQKVDKTIARLETALKSDKVKKFLEEKYKGAIVPLF